MQEITVNSGFGNQLDGLAGQAIVCDAEGRVLGIFSPIHDRPHRDDLQLEPLLSIAETEELRKVQSGKPLNEILVRLNVT
jgi:hypothetical protein